jgi:hypothetical protein
VGGVEREGGREREGEREKIIGNGCSLKIDKTQKDLSSHVILACEQKELINWCSPACG